MEHGACNVIYVDRRAHDEHIKRETLSSSLIARTSTGNVGQSYFALGKAPPAEVHANVESILTIFSEGKTKTPIVKPNANPMLTHSTSLHLWLRQIVSVPNHPAGRQLQHTNLCHSRRPIRRRIALKTPIART